MTCFCGKSSHKLLLLCVWLYVYLKNGQLSSCTPHPTSLLLLQIRFLSKLTLWLHSYSPQAISSLFEVNIIFLKMRKNWVYSIKNIGWYKEVFFIWISVCYNCSLWANGLSIFEILELLFSDFTYLHSFSHKTALDKKVAVEHKMLAIFGNKIWIFGNGTELRILIWA
jgi:hypothetical protein